MKNSLLTIIIAMLLTLTAGSSRAADFPTETAWLKSADAAMAQCAPKYNGHRARAMAQVQAAGRIIGISLPNPRHGNLSIAQSNAKLREARVWVQRAHDSLAAKNKPVATRHCANALRQIDLSLTVR